MVERLHHMNDEPPIVDDQHGVREAQQQETQDQQATGPPPALIVHVDRPAISDGKPDELSR
jgi:hypothetical protein